MGKFNYYTQVNSESFQQNAAPIEYLEKAHQQLEMCKKKEEEGKKRLEDLQTELDFKSVQVIYYMH